MKNIPLLLFCLSIVSCKRTPIDINTLIGKYSNKTYSESSSNVTKIGSSSVEGISIELLENNISIWKSQFTEEKVEYHIERRKIIFNNQYTAQVNNSSTYFYFSLLVDCRVNSVNDSNGDGLDDSEGTHVGEIVSESVTYDFTKD